jgi:hypothetical protein
MIRINREKYLKHTITDLEAPNEPSSSEFPILGNYSCEFEFSNLTPYLSKVLLSHRSELSLHDSHEIIEQCNKSKQNTHAQSDNTKMMMQEHHSTSSSAIQPTHQVHI